MRIVLKSIKRIQISPEAPLRVVWKGSGMAIHSFPGIHSDGTSTLTSTLTSTFDGTSTLTSTLTFDGASTLFSTLAFAFAGPDETDPSSPILGGSRGSQRAPT